MNPRDKRPLPAINHAPKVPAPPSAHIPRSIQLSRPPGARGYVSYYTLDGSERATDGTKHWYLNRYGTWTRTRTHSVPSYNRFQPSQVGRGGVRKASFAVREGSAASYADVRPRVHSDEVLSVAAKAVARMSHAKRTYKRNMLEATTAEGICPTDSATVYALHFGAPPIAGGYNWCHLHGHGAGGSDDASNIVAGSTHCNSEQLQIEKIVYQYPNKGVSLSFQVRRHGLSQYLARWIKYYVWVNGRCVYTREMNAFRATKPSWVEVAKVADDLVKAITGAFR